MPDCAVRPVPRTARRALGRGPHVRICASLIEEAEAIGWYEQRLDLERDPDAPAIMENAQGEEFKHFAMNLEFLGRRKPEWAAVLKRVLFQPGDIVEHGEEAEEELDAEG